MTKMCS